jgi:organic radical activating enzyme
MTKPITIETAETFWSFQGEVGVGKPQVWIRTTMCNFECRKFGNPNNEDTTSIATLGFDPRDYKTLESMPIITKGCDSSYSWNRDLFKHTWTKWNLDDLAAHLVELIPHHSWVHPVTKQAVGFAITGGEPTLKLRELAELLHHPLLKELQTVTIETNCSVPIRWEQIMRLNQWLSESPNRKLIWSNSPKLSNSGEAWEKAICPDVALKQMCVMGPGPNNAQVKQYFKFVSDGSDESFAEIHRAMQVYYVNGISDKVEVWIMPEGATLDQQDGAAKMICNKAMALGYNVAPRVHVYVYGNAVNT